MPFSFHISLPSDAVAAGAPTRINIAKSIQEDVLEHPSDAFTPEDVFVVRCSPQAVFKVRPATRCSSTLSGAHNETPPMPSRAHSISGHASPILCASFSPTGNLLATGAGDCNARLWDLFTETPSHTLSGHKGWVLCVEWEGMERRLATGGHDGHVRILLLCFQIASTDLVFAGAAVGPKNGQSHRRRAQGPLEVGDLARLGAHPPVRPHIPPSSSRGLTDPITRNASAPRLASSSKDGTVRVWHASSTRALDYALGGHTASVNVVRWGGGGSGSGRGVLYTGSSDRTVRVWDANGVRSNRRWSSVAAPADGGGSRRGRCCTCSRTTPIG